MRNKNIKGRNMKLSVEAKVAAAVAAGFMVMSSGAMAQGHKGQTAGSNHYGPTNNPGANTHMNQQGDNSSLFGRTNAEENKPTVSDEKVTSSVRERREERRENREQREDRRENREQREDRRENREQRQDRHQAHRQREERRQSTSTPKEKSPFDGSILEVKPGDVSR
jgi:transcription termination factor Rho